jgi:hypothetical protein
MSLQTSDCGHGKLLAAHPMRILPTNQGLAQRRCTTPASICRAMPKLGSCAFDNAAGYHGGPGGVDMPQEATLTVNGVSQTQSFTDLDTH